MRNKLYRKEIDTPIGMMTACTTEEGVCFLEHPNAKGLVRELNALLKTCDTKVFAEGENAVMQLLERELRAYFAGELRTFTVPIDMRLGTDFQRSVWQTLLKIPYGKTWSYKEEAAALGRPKSVRAVANANGANPISIVVPCHRVIGADGSLTGYGGGLAAKEHLLNLEVSDQKSEISG